MKCKFHFMFCLCFFVLLFSSYWKFQKFGNFWYNLVRNTVFSTAKQKRDSLSCDGWNSMYDIMMKTHQSFLKCLCKSIMDFLICNFSWKWPWQIKVAKLKKFSRTGVSVFSCVYSCVCVLEDTLFSPSLTSWNFTFQRWFSSLDIPQLHSDEGQTLFNELFK